MKRGKRKQRPICPCCNIGRHLKEMEIVVGLFQEYHDKQFPNLETKIKDQDFLQADFEWACDVCITARKAVIAIPSKQVTSGYPNMAYSDTLYTCGTCENDFLFHKEEKQLWYEKLQFSTSSIPYNCTACRKTIRKQKNENKQLSALLRKPEPELSKVELQQIIALYKEWDKPEKVAYFNSVLKKKWFLSR